MIVRLLPTNEQHRWFIPHVWRRIEKFCEKYTNEIPYETSVKGWMLRWLNGLGDLFLIVNINDDMQLDAHCLICIEEMNGIRVLICHQCEDDRKSKEFFDFCIKALDEMALQLQASCISIVVSKNERMYEKKYGYEIARKVLIKHVNKEEVANG